MNKLIITGHLGNDPELRSTQSGIPVCSFNLAVNDRKGESTTWFRVTAWRQLAELCAKHLAKGRRVGVVGSVALNEYKGRDGQNRYSLEVQADEVEFLDSRKQAEKGFTQIENDPDLPF